MQKSWDSVWEKVYAEQGFRGKYPDEFVVRFVAGRFFPLSIKERGKARVLDLGSGPGRHTVFLAKEGFSAFAIEGSPQAVSLCKKKLKELKLKAIARTGDFVNLPYPEGYFDAVIDCTSIQHNRIRQVRKILAECRRVLKPRGELFSMVRTDKDYASHPSVKQATKVENGTFTGYRKFDLNGVGLIHFFSEKEIKELYSVFRKVSYEYTERTFDNRSKKITHWVIRAEK